MRIHSLTVEQALTSLNSSAGGLSASEAARRLAEFGPNHLEEVEREHLLLRLAREFTHFFAIILWIGAALAFFAEHFDPGQGMARLGVAIIGVIIINGVFSFWQEYKAERAVAALRHLLPQKATALRAGEIVEILASDLVPGDLLLLEEGDFVPADCRLIAVFGLRVNLSTVTGESLAKARNVEPSLEESPLQARNILLAGTSIVSGQARGAVYATGMRTEFGRIAHLTQTAGETTSPLQREIARLSRIVACLATGMGVTVFFVGQAMGLPTWENVLFAIGIIVANVPEGLLPTVTLSLAMATQRMAKRNALVRHLPAVEALGSTTVICSDKTGTLTQNRMLVQQLWLGGAFLPCTDLATNRQLAQDHRELFVNAALCHDLKEVDEQGMTLAGLIGLADPPRAEVPEAIARCNAAGIRIIMVSGDHPRTALAIARQIRMVRSEQPVVIIGEQLRLMSATQLQLALDAPEILFARVAAELQILAVDLGTDMLPALALGAEKPDPAVMTRPPRARGERLLSWGLMARAYLFLGVLEAAAAMFVFFFVLDAGGWHFGQWLDRTDPLYLQATSACLAAIVVTQIVNVYLCRHPRKSVFTYGFGGNPYLQLGILAEVTAILFILYTSPGNWLFGTAPVDSATWLLAAGCAALMWSLEELRKAALRRTSKD